MKTKNKPVDVWGMESNVQIPVRIYASDDDLSSDGKLILCSRKQKMRDDVEYVSKQWLMQTLKECLADSPDILGRISARLETNTIWNPCGVSWGEYLTYPPIAVTTKPIHNHGQHPFR